MLLLANWKFLTMRDTCVVEVKTIFRGLLVTISVAVLLGCGRSQHSGIGSANDYGYAAETPEKRDAVIRRFEGAATLLTKAGLQTRPLQDANDHRQLAFAGKGIEGSLKLALPDTGLASILLNFQTVSSGPAGAQEGRQLLAELQKLLAPSTSDTEKTVKSP